MTTSSRNQISAETRRTIFSLRIRRGAEEALSSLPRGMILLVYILLAIFCCITVPARYAAAPGENPLAPVIVLSYRIFLSVLFLAGLSLLLYCFGYPLGAVRVQNALHRAGVVNSAGEAPVLLRRCVTADEEALTCAEVFAPGIALSTWENRRPEVETALNCHIYRVVPGRQNDRFLVFYVEGGAILPDRIPWTPELLHKEDDSTLVLGLGYTGRITTDLQTIPHILIGGSTGSGKSMLLKCLLLQLHHKGVSIAIADFKGGVDFLPAWKEGCRRFITDEEELIAELEFLLEELEHRKKLLLEYRCANIQEFNKLQPMSYHMTRLVFACDEVAELFDKTGRGKEDRERIDRIINLISTIARLGRAFGIHLILATQRPDAQILPGQIKNNMDCKVCGRADNVLSQIILDSTDAADLIPKDSHLFLRSDGTLFQPYLIDEETF